jgi:hypothetical protein
MTDSMELFGQISNSIWFKDKSMVLFLNKSDIFREKIKEKPISVLFTDLEGDRFSRRLHHFALS